MTNHMKLKKHLLSLAVSAGFLFSATTVLANEDVTIDIRPQSLASALRELGEQSNLQLIFKKSDVLSMESSALSGQMSPESALRQMLAGTGFTYEYTAENMVVVKKEGESGKGIKKTIDNRSEKLMEEMTVTAQKRAQSLQDVPMSIAALSGDELDEQGIDNILGLALKVPGLSVQDSGTMQRRIMMRGIGNVFGESPLVGLYVDEMSVTGTSSQALDVRTYDLERVEVLRGPQGTLYGDGSLGGTIRFITKSPELDNFRGGVDFTNSFTKGGDASQQMIGVLNVPLLEDRLGVRLGILYEDAGGWLDQPERSLKNLNDQETYDIRAKVLWRPSDALEIQALAITHRNDSGPAANRIDDNGNYYTPFGRESTASFYNEYSLFNTTVTYDFGGLQLLSTSSYIDGDNNWQQDRGYLPLSPAPALPLEWLVLDGYAQRFRQEIFTEELRLSSDDSGPFVWSAGVYYRNRDYQYGTLQNGQHVEGGVPYYCCYEGSEVALTDTPFTRKSESWAVFGNVSYDVSELLELGVGLRYFNDDQELKNQTFQSGSFNSTNPRFYANYSVNDNIQLYANFAKGFRSGGFNNFGFPVYEPENLWSYEVGTKMSLLENKLDAELSVFYTDYEGVQIVGINPDPVGNVTSNAGDAEVKGVEWLLSFHATENFTIGVSGTKTDSEIVKLAIGGSSHAVGDPLDLVPSYSFAFWADYNFYWSGQVPGFARIDYSQQGKSIFRNRSIGAHYLGYSDVINMMNARLGLQRDNWSFEFFAQNLLNEDGFLDALQIERNAAVPRPRTFGIKVGLDF